MKVWGRKAVESIDEKFSNLDKKPRKKINDLKKISLEDCQSKTF